ncbi:MAG: hypothetical protein K2X84_04600, partial [Beijerinckiaceae bacterium]|nr:hypothetical protein [Beijerinckiaceae bacterium]
IDDMVRRLYTVKDGHLVKEPVVVAPTPGTTAPATGAEKPRLVNPTDVRGSETGERTPPLARSDNPGIPAQLPPVQPQDSTSAQPRSETPAVPVVPMD